MNGRRVTRGIMRKIGGEADLESVFAHLLMLARRVREQRQHQRGKKVSILCTGEPAVAGHVGDQDRRKFWVSPMA